MKPIIVAFGLTIAAISANAQHNHSQHTNPSTKQAPVTNAKNAKTQAQELYQHYIGIKDALVAGSQAQAVSHAKILSQSASLISYKEISEKNIKAISKYASAIAEAKDIAAQRKAFSNLSNNITALAERFKLSASPVYQQYCPMAKAYWLSNEREIRNPYYGSKMLNCGSVTKTF